MRRSEDIVGAAAQRLREFLRRAVDWRERRGMTVGQQPVDLVVQFRLGPAEHTLVLGSVALGQPRHVRAAITRFGEIRRDLPEAYPVAVAPYLSPQSAGLLKRSGAGYLDLSGNCHLAFENVLIDREGRPNLRPSTRPLKSLFAPRATRVVRVLLVDPQHEWRLEELAKAAEVSLGHAHNVVKRLQELGWAERGAHQRIALPRPGELLDAWTEAYSYRVNEVGAYFSAERVTRALLAEVARAAHAEGRRHAFTLHAGAALVAPNVRVPAVHCYVEGDPTPIARSLSLRPAQGEGNVNLVTPYDAGVFYAPIVKGGIPVVSLPQLYADLYRYERRGREQAVHLRREAMGY